MIQQPKPNLPPKRQDSRYNEFLKYLQKRMRELSLEEKKFREMISKEKKHN